MYDIFPKNIFLSQILITLKQNFYDIELKFLDFEKLFSAHLLHMSTNFPYRLVIDMEIRIGRYR